MLVDIERVPSASQTPEAAQGTAAPTRYAARIPAPQIGYSGWGIRHLTNRAIGKPTRAIHRLASRSANLGVSSAAEEKRAHSGAPSSIGRRV